MSTAAKFAGAMGSHSGRISCSQARADMHSAVQIMYDSGEAFTYSIYSTATGNERVKDIIGSIESHPKSCLSTGDLLVVDGKVYLYSHPPKELKAVEVAQWFCSRTYERVQMSL